MRRRSERLYEFGHFSLDPVKRVLLRSGEAVTLTAKVFDTLLVLVEHRGQILSKDELMRRLWPDTVVEENNLTQQISMLRKTLGERAGDHAYVVTVPGRGYSFVADVREVWGEEADEDVGVILEQHTRSLITFGVEDEGDEGGAPPQRGRAKFLPVAAVHALPHPRTRVYLATLAVAGLLAGAITLLFGRWATPPPQTRGAEVGRTLAVLPFKSLGSGPEDNLLGAGMTDTLIAKLSNVRQITVRPTSSVIRYADSPPDTLAAGRELGVDSVLEGTVQRADDRVRVTVQLLSVPDGSPLWAQSFDERLDDIFAVQDAISERVAQTMLSRLTGEEQQRLRKHYTGSVEAYQAYLTGRHFWNKRSKEGVLKSAEAFRRAIDLDPAYALAHAGLADAYSILAFYKFGATTPEENYRRAQAAALKALELDDSLAEAHTSLASILAARGDDGAAAEREYRRAIELNPNYATAHHWYSEYLTTEGRTEEAMAEIRRAQELDPLSPVISTTLAERLYFARRYDEAIEQLGRTLEIDPAFTPAHYTLGLAYGQKGMHAEAIAALEKARESSGGGLPIVAALGYTYAIAGRKAEARRVLDELTHEDEAASYAIATIYTGLGERQRAFEWLQKVRSDKRWLLESDPMLDALRSDPRFQNLLRA